MLPPAELLRVLEKIRAVNGKPLSIISGHRCTATNRAVGGAPRSRHLVGDAVDIPLRHVTVTMAAEAGAVGIGERDGWAVHIDVRPGPPVRWRY